MGEGRKEKKEDLLLTHRWHLHFCRTFYFNVWAWENAAGSSLLVGANPPPVCILGLYHNNVPILERDFFTVCRVVIGNGFGAPSIHVRLMLRWIGARIYADHVWRRELGCQQQSMYRKKDAIFLYFVVSLCAAQIYIKTSVCEYEGAGGGWMAKQAAPGTGMYTCMRARACGRVGPRGEWGMQFETTT